MANIGDTGNGATFTLTTQTAVSTYKVKSIDIGEVSVDMLDVSSLSTSGDMERIVSDLRKHGDLTVTCYHNAYSTALTVSMAQDTATITLPIGPSQTTTTGATFVASGYVTSVKYPSLANGTVQEAVYKFSPDGDTGPTYTRGA